MKKRTMLMITDAIKEMAKQNGAYLDTELKEWFVDGDVPDALISFVVKEARRRDYVAEVVPQCERCGSHMTLRSIRSTGNAFWMCSSVCCGKSRSFEDVGVRRKDESARVDQGAVEPQEFQDKLRAARVIARAIQLFRNEPLAMAWLEAPKVDLRNHGSIPLRAIKTIAGCAITERLLEERFE